MRPSGMPVTIYSGEVFDGNVSVLIARNPEHLRAVWSFCSVPTYQSMVRAIDQAVKVTNNALVNVLASANWILHLAEQKTPNMSPKMRLLGKELGELV